MIGAGIGAGSSLLPSSGTGEGGGGTTMTGAKELRWSGPPDEGSGRFSGDVRAAGTASSEAASSRVAAVSGIAVSAVLDSPVSDRVVLGSRVAVHTLIDAGTATEVLVSAPALGVGATGPFGAAVALRATCAFGAAGGAIGTADCDVAGARIGGGGATTAGAREADAAPSACGPRGASSAVSDWARSTSRAGVAGRAAAPAGPASPASTPLDHVRFPRTRLIRTATQTDSGWPGPARTSRERWNADPVVATTSSNSRRPWWDGSAARWARSSTARADPGGPPHSPRTRSPATSTTATCSAPGRAASACTYRSAALGSAPRAVLSAADVASTTTPSLIASGLWTLAR
jgi:hypothetical protein